MNFEKLKMIAKGSVEKVKKFKCPYIRYNFNYNNSKNVTFLK